MNLIRKIRWVISGACAVYGLLKLYEVSQRAYPLGDTTMPVADPSDGQPTIEVDENEITLIVGQNGKGRRY